MEMLEKNYASDAADCDVDIFDPLTRDLMEDAVRRKEKPGRVYSRLSLSLYLDLYGVDPDTRDETKIDDYVPDEFIRAFVHFVRNFHPFFSLPPRPVYTSLKDRAISGLETEIKFLIQLCSRIDTLCNVEVETARTQPIHVIPESNDFSVDSFSSSSSSASLFYVEKVSLPIFTSTPKSIEDSLSSLLDSVPSESDVVLSSYHSSGSSNMSSSSWSMTHRSSTGVLNSDSLSSRLTNSSSESSSRSISDSSLHSFSPRQPASPRYRLFCTSYRRLLGNSSHSSFSSLLFHRENVLSAKDSCYTEMHSVRENFDNFVNNIPIRYPTLSFLLLDLSILQLHGGCFSSRSRVHSRIQSILRDEASEPPYSSLHVNNIVAHLPFFVNENAVLSFEDDAMEVCRGSKPSHHHSTHKESVSSCDEERFGDINSLASDHDDIMKRRRSRSMGPQTTFLSSAVESISGKQRAVSSSSPSYGAIVEYVASPPLVRHFSSSSAEECKLKHINRDATQPYSSKSPVSTENSSGCFTLLSEECLQNEMFSASSRGHGSFDSSSSRLVHRPLQAEISNQNSSHFQQLPVVASTRNDSSDSHSATSHSSSHSVAASRSQYVETTSSIGISAVQSSVGVDDSRDNDVFESGVSRPFTKQRLFFSRRSGMHEDSLEFSPSIRSSWSDIRSSDKNLSTELSRGRESSQVYSAPPSLTPSRHSLYHSSKFSDDYWNLSDSKAWKQEHRSHSFCAVQKTSSNFCREQFDETIFFSSSGSGIYLEKFGKMVSGSTDNPGGLAVTNLHLSSGVHFFEMRVLRLDGDSIMSIGLVPANISLLEKTSIHRTRRIPIRDRGYIGKRVGILVNFEEDTIELYVNDALVPEFSLSDCSFSSAEEWTFAVYIYRDCHSVSLHRYLRHPSFSLFDSGLSTRTSSWRDELSGSSNACSASCT